MFCKNEIEEYLQKNNNRKPVIMTSIDEATFVIKPTEETIGEYPDNWSQIATTIGETVSEKLSLPTLFGEYTPLKTPPAGYTDGFTFQHLPITLRLLGMRPILQWALSLSSLLQLFLIIKLLIKSIIIKRLMFTK